MGLQLLGPAPGPGGEGPLPLLPGEGVCHGEPPLRRGRLGHEEAGAEGRGRGVLDDMEAVPG